MIKVLIVETSRNFIDDLNRTLLIDEREDISVTVLEDINYVENYIYENKYDALIIQAALLESRDWNFNLPIRTYAKNDSSFELSESYGYKCYGIITRSRVLLDNIASDNFNYNIYEGNNEENTTVLTKDMAENSSKNTVDTTNNYQQSNTYYQEDNQTQKYDAVNNGYYSYYPMYEGQPIAYYDTQNNAVYWVDSTYYNEERENGYIEQFPGTYQQNNYQKTEPVYSENANYEQNYNQKGNNQESYQKEYEENNQASSDYYNKEKILYANSNLGVNRLQLLANQREINKKKEIEEKGQAEKEFDKDMGNVKERAKCITVYSAKGGVGKTTISCELASFLALTSHNRSNYKVCIADFNIDFGDVMNTLAFDSRGANMTTWAENIKTRIRNGEKPEDINYSESEIMVWLQKKEDTGLYALLAPTSNVDSMYIGEDEIRVMVENLINNCGFDFVICDTGNNTRDSSFIALEKADMVMLVLTQDVNTANCNNSFLRTAERVGFDMNKIKLVINLVRPTKIVGIGPEELETAFINEKTKRPYRFETLARIKQSNDVVNYGNKGEPLVFNSAHDFTKSIGKIVGKVTGKEQVLTAPEKKNFFEKLFKK